MGVRRRTGVWSGKFFSPADFDRLRALIREHPDAQRAQLARLACEAFDWRGATGVLRRMRMRVVMLRMHEAGLIALPPSQRRKPADPRPQDWVADTFPDPGSPITDRVDLLPGLTLQTVTAAEHQASRAWNASIAAFHYLGYQRPVGHQLRYIVSCDRGPLACIGFASAAWKTAPRDERIGWTHEQRERALPHIINNTRFLILPWVHSPNLASWILATCAKRLRTDWLRVSGFEPLLLETFVDATKYTGHCYRAANWIHLGVTQGRGRYDRHTRRAITQKHIWVLPLVRNPWGKLKEV